jgi:serine/threonine protein kinase
MIQIQHKTFIKYLDKLLFSNSNRIFFMETIVGKDYKLSKKLGSGAFGEVFLAIHTRTQHEYAVKM